MAIFEEKSFRSGDTLSVRCDRCNLPLQKAAAQDCDNSQKHMRQPYELEPAGWIYTVYESPSDYPGKFVVRRYDRFSGAAELVAWAVSSSLDLVRESIPAGLTRISRVAEDDDVILETWL